ncbi:MAG: mechanosensitive ion channel family protein [Gammaproteobacteria bacterium]|nr:MAG: mechanosensitive ion channel family protein [Gammaproteobacteria bacterium]
MRKLQKLLAILLVPGTLALTESARGQGLDTVPDASDIALLSQIIDWTGIVQAAVVILFAWLLLRFVDRIVEDLGKSIAERRLLLQRINAFFRFSVYLTTIAFIVLVSFDFSPRVLAVIGGASVVAVGFATRDLLASLVGGILIILDRPFQIGDRVKFGGEYGDIKKIGLRSVKLTTLDDSTVTIPNNLFLSEVTSSSNSGQLDMQTVVDFYIGLDQDVHRARELIREAAATSRYIYLPKPINVLAAQLPLDGCVSMHLRLKAYVLDTKYEKDFETDVTLRVHRAFADHSILPPLIFKREID